MKNRLTSGAFPLRAITLLLSVALLAAAFSCAPLPTDVEPETTSTPEATKTPMETPDPVTPAPVTPAPTPESQEPDGVAGPMDVLPSLKSYREAKAINDEVIGWITIPNTNIDYPVVRGDDLLYYTTHNVEKEDSKYGAIFMDFRNADPKQQRHIIVYGHNMKNGTMFHDLNNFKQRAFFMENRIITFLWEGVETQWEVYAAYVVEENEAYYIRTRFDPDQRELKRFQTQDEFFVEYMNALLDYAKSSKYSVVDDIISIKATDQVLTLSTCTYEYDNSRFAVSARRII